MKHSALRLVGTDMDSNENHLDQFTEWLRSWGASENTTRERATLIRAGLRIWGPLEHVDTECLQRWLAQPRFSAWTRVTYCSHLRSYFGWLHTTGRIETNPATELRSPRTPDDRPWPLAEAEVALVLDAARGRMHTWLILGLFAGLRAHEMAKLRGDDVEQDVLYVFGKGQQGAFLPTHPMIWAQAQAYPGRGYWFPAPRAGSGHVASRSISTMTTRLFTSLGIEGSIHRCRHTYGTRLLRGGANIRVVQSLMRHKSLASTAKYTDVADDERRRAVQQLCA